MSLAERLTEQFAEARRRGLSLGDLDDLPPTLPLDQAAKILDIGRTLAHQLARRGRFPVPVILIGSKKMVVPTAPLLRALGLEPKDGATPVGNGPLSQT
jgi:hypothetical protein